jgi:O-antigen ligase
MLSTSRGGILCAIPALIGMDIYCGLKIKDKKRYTIFCLGSVSLVLVVMVATLNITLPYIQFILERFFENSGAGDITSGRINLYIQAWEMFKTSPIIGIGTVLSVKYGVSAWYHSTLFDTLAGLGIIGLVALGFHLFQKYKFYIKNIKDPFVFLMYIGIICSGLYGMIDVSYYNIIWLFIFVAMLSCLETQVKLETLTTLNK